MMTNLDKRESIVDSFDEHGYVLGNDLATIIFLMRKLEKPLLLEGNPGVGKTAIASVLAQATGAELIRLQCYEGLDINSSVYEWNYQKQLLSIKIQEQDDSTTEEKERHIFGPDFLLERPLLRAITSDRPTVLLIDEVDRADEEFEAFLLELLSEYQISIPEFGTVKAKHKPLVLLTSNRTRDLSDALKRRCLYHWVEYPEMEKELRIVMKHHPDIEERLARNIVSIVHEVRKLKLLKTPGISETIDWVSAIVSLGFDEITAEGMQQTLGCLLKSADDVDKFTIDEIERLMEAV